MCFIGDGNNMANSLMVGALKMGMKFSIACPEGYHPDAELTKWVEEFGDKFEITSDVKKAAKDADVLYTDVWASRGRKEKRRFGKSRLRASRIDARSWSAPKRMRWCCIVCPAHRGEEISEDVLEAHADDIFDEAENRLHAQKAVMCKLMRD